ncbi:flagellar basal-body rod protein FlgG [bacterium]|nr:flagellar basal-body rod protein FlgG [bacterium]
MMRALSTSASGMRAQQIFVDTIAHNLANVNTTGFKRGRVEFQDLLYQVVQPNASQAAGGDLKPIQVGHGVRLADIKQIFTQGPTQVTGNALDMAVNGDGFFRVEMPDGSYAYTRDGSFALSSEGQVTTSGGLAVAPGFELPEGATEVAIGREGEFSVKVAGEETAQELGSIDLYRFANPAGLKAMGNNLFLATESSGDAQEGTAGRDGYGSIESGILETSNVSVVEEMIRLIEAQRAYELNSKSIQTSEDMLAVAGGLKR